MEYKGDKVFVCVREIESEKDASSLRNVEVAKREKTDRACVNVHVHVNDEVC